LILRTMNKLQVIGIGALNIDNIYRIDRLLSDGEAVATEKKSYPGGSAANTVYGLAKLGINTGFVGSIGDDQAGQAILLDFKKASVDTGGIRIKKGEKTGSVICLSDKEGKRSIYVMPGANDNLDIKDINMDYLAEAGLIHISSFAGEKQFGMVAEFVINLPASLKISFSPGALFAARGIEKLEAILKRTYILFVNRDELRQITGGSLTEGAEECLKYGCRIVAVTLGGGYGMGKEENDEAGGTVSYIKDKTNEYYIEGGRKKNIAVVDTTGAGDAFAAGFLYGLLQDKGLAECGRLGNTVAKLSISKTGARLGLPCAARLTSEYEKLYG